MVLGHEPADIRERVCGKSRWRTAPSAMIISEFGRVSAALWSVVSTRKGHSMLEKTTALDQMQTAYIAAVEQWIDAIKQEEALASVNHTIAEVDKWEKAHFKEDEIRNRVKSAKKQYENALREKFFGF
jgi:hypothetical protein